MKKEQKIWHSVEIETETAAEESVEFTLNELDALGTEINFGKQKTETVKIIGYFNEKPEDEILQNALNYSLNIYGFSADSIKKIEWCEVENQDWLAEWKKHWKPTETGKFIIAPTWETVENKEKIVIRIEPSMAFGTGTHETTRLCLKAIEENYAPEMSFLDVGTGTGILAIAAVKFRVPSSEFRVVGCDTDGDAIKIAIENAELNEAKNIDFYVGSISEETLSFDFVCANLTADVILPLLPLLIRKTNKILVLSGILEEQENLIVSELNRLKTTNFKIETDSEWISILIKI